MDDMLMVACLVYFQDIEPSIEKVELLFHRCDFLNSGCGRRLQVGLRLRDGDPYDAIFDFLCFRIRCLDLGLFLHHRQSIFEVCIPPVFQILVAL
jgi:hypothetical protein